MITPLRRSGMARVLKGSYSFTCTPRVYPLTEWTIPAFVFPAEAGTHLPTPEGWKAELALGGCLVITEMSVRHLELNPDTVAHLNTNRARRRLTSLIEANALTTTPDHHHICVYRHPVQISTCFSLRCSYMPFQVVYTGDNQWAIS